MLFKNMKNTFIITGLQFNNIFKKKKTFLNWVTKLLALEQETLVVDKGLKYWAFLALASEE